MATAHCSPYGQTLTYWPLRGLLEELFTPTFGPEHIVNAFAGGGLSREDAERLTGLVLAALGVEREDAVERETIWSAWQLLIGVLSAQARRIIVFEDLHWASESLLDLVEYPAQPRTQAPLLIVATSRPELLDGGQPGRWVAQFQHRGVEAAQLCPNSDPGKQAEEAATRDDSPADRRTFGRQPSSLSS